MDSPRKKKISKICFIEDNLFYSGLFFSYYNYEIRGGNQKCWSVVVAAFVVVVDAL